MLPFPEIEKIAEPLPPVSGTSVSIFWWIGASLVAVIAMALVVGWIRSALQLRGLPGLPGKADRQANQALETLQKSSEGMDALTFAGQLHEIVRVFMHRRLGVPARFSTTEELLGRTGRGDLPPPIPAVLGFAPILAACDSVKFLNPNMALDRTALINQTRQAVAKAIEPLSAQNSLSPSSSARPPACPPSLPLSDAPIA